MGGPQAEWDVCPSSQASSSNKPDFQAKKMQKPSTTTSMML